MTGLTPARGTLERILLDKLKEKGKEGVVYADLAGTGINKDNIGALIENLKSGMFEAEGDHLLKEDA